MYRLTCKLLVSFSLILPTLAATVPVSGRTGERDKRDVHYGDGTWYNTGLGSCGIISTDDQDVVAISQEIMNKDTDCFKMVQITSNGVTGVAQIVDTCTGCGPDDLDMSPALFGKFSSLEVGVVPIEWYEL